MKKFIIASIILFTSFSFAGTCEDFSYGGKLPQTSQQHVLLCKKEFTIGYSTINRTPLFVLQKLEAEKVTAPTVLSPSAFKLDPALSKNQQPALADFVGSGLDRGHMAPLEDNNHSAQSALDSMMLTNIVPQNAGNNRGIWRVLEARTREMSLDSDIFVISGPIFENNGVIDGTDVRVPTKLFKIVVNVRKQTITTYIIPNESVPSSALPSFVSNLDTVRSLTGIDMIPILSMTETR